MVTEVNFDFDDTDNTIQGTVLANGEQPTSLSVRAEIQTEFGKEIIRERFANTGDYILTNLPIGEATINVRASLADRSRATETFNVTITGGTIQHNLDLNAEP